MQLLRSLTLILFAVAIFAGAADAQKRPAKKPAPKKPAAVPQKIVPPLDVRAAREKVDNQLSNVTRFIEVYGPRADALELLDRAFATKRVSDGTIAKHEANKKNTIQSIRNLRDGLSALESEFRTKSALQTYLPKLQGITDLIQQSADSAVAGQFVAAKAPLREIAGKLTDTLAILPR